MIVPPPKDQDKGLAHCHYIRQLAHQIWLKENAKISGGIKVRFEDCIRRALTLHRKKLINNQVDRIIPSISNSRMTKIIPPNRRIGW